MERRCNRCGLLRGADEWYPPRADGKVQAWCKPCYREWHRARYAPKPGGHDEPRACDNCGVIYQPGQRRPSSYCSRPCKDTAKARARQAAIDALKPARACLQCGTPIGRERRSDAKFCSPECNAAAHKLARSLRARGGSNGAHGYIRIQIADRDGWRCGICGGRVSQEARHPDPMVASLDHVVPVSQGGTSDPANLRLAHLQCNVRRRDGGGGEQLALH